ncbi:MAG: FAD-dependent oxidoreductase [Novosphingobium sp. 28-62-57]|uniref:NAD(P)/FAD-dependent oxidoreductase n=1 Tax=unclassified Novosphingobium TaxID=2644732 RepID=UPI000BC3CC61|nr:MULTISPECIES: FAD-dependent oxidoreductase [unclassified Novosphingobium]OYW50794.1 MAG: FAD-dependent oxidoreductase [Novosphingobium sp. 12-62-10]OYZ10068.1 MAG: FAD-dependent oxidoreductase [Novosphingobium sp. 28-62-57]OZA33901.1 MAG: FAD-dependent oxidoreductase [Novosphingobium sp. 17-62-9]HQS69334.1 FAD-dependent oxidoreductase [Novosphingobium sp.]
MTGFAGDFDVAVIGAGMAGASLAAECAPHARVLLVEAEDTPGYHTTGRSAAFWEETYGGPGVVPLTMASGRFLREGGYLSPRGALNIGQAADRDKVEAFAETFTALGATLHLQDRAAIAARVPGLRPDWVIGVWEPECADIDVAGLHQHYLAASKRTGSVLRVRARVEQIEREGEGWRIGWRGGEARVAMIANAAGAWADGLATLAGAAPLGIQPLRRTIVQVRTDPAPPEDLPLVLGINEDFYFKPQGGRLWLSPHDEIPDVAGDAAPEELDVAIAIDRFEHVVDWQIAAVERRWAGLRSFAPDRLPVYGFDPAVPGLFWFAGQGGFGIQTAPAAARLAAQLLLGLPRDGLTAEIDAAVYAPARFAAG